MLNGVSFVVEVIVNLAPFTNVDLWSLELYSSTVPSIVVSFVISANLLLNVVLVLSPSIAFEPLSLSVCGTTLVYVRPLYSNST